MTKTTDGWWVDHWFGSITTLADAADVAEVELNQIDPKDDDEENNALLISIRRHLRVWVTYEGGTFTGDSIEELREELGDLEGKDGIEAVTFEVETPNYRAMMSAATHSGLRVDITGTGATVVHGLVSTLKRKLEPGVERVREQSLRPMNWKNYWAFGIGWVGGLVLGFLGIYGLATDDFNWVYVGAIVVALVYFVVGTQIGMRRTRPDPPRLQLVPASEEDDPPPQQDERGPIVLARDWVRRHPIISSIITVVVTLVLAVVGNLLTDAIT